MKGQGANGDGWVSVTHRRRRNDSRREWKTDWRLGNTFFIRNFPDECRKEDLWRRIEEIGKVEDIFIPSKRDKMGGRFGFVRLSSERSDTDILHYLNNMWFGSYIIRASIPKYERPVYRKGNEREEAKLGNDRSLRQDKSEGIIVPRRRNEGLKYVEVVIGETQAEVEPTKLQQNRECSVNFQSIEEEAAWLKGAFTGFLLDEFSWEEHGDEMRNECLGSLSLTYIGSDMVLLRSTTEKSSEEVLKGYEDWSKSWFKSWRPWRYSDFNEKREVWTKWIGVPLQAWSRRFFEMMGSNFGKLIEVHEMTSSRKRLDAAFVRVGTGLCPIDKVVECRVDGQLVKILVEEINCLEQEANLWQDYEEDLATESVGTCSEKYDGLSFKAEHDDACRGSDGKETVIGGGGVLMSNSGGEESACANIDSSEKVAATPEVKSWYNDESRARVEDERYVRLPQSLGCDWAPKSIGPGQQVENGPVVGGEKGDELGSKVGRPSLDLGASPSMKGGESVFNEKVEEAPTLVTRKKNGKGDQRVKIVVGVFEGRQIKNGRNSRG